METGLSKSTLQSAPPPPPPPPPPNMTAFGGTGGLVMTLLSECCNKILEHINSGFQPTMSNKRMKWFNEVYHFRLWIVNHLCIVSYCIVLYSLMLLLGNKYLFIVIAHRINSNISLLKARATPLPRATPFLCHIVNARLMPGGAFDYSSSQEICKHV